jgi:hypothetical protein
MVKCDRPTTHKQVFRTALEWAAIHNDKIMDPDGWRNNGDGVDLNTPIKYHDYMNRLAESTVEYLDRSILDRYDSVRNDD